MSGLKSAAVAAAACVFAASNAHALVATPDASGNFQINFDFPPLDSYINVQLVKVDIKIDPSIDLNIEAWNYVLGSFFNSSRTGGYNPDYFEFYNPADSIEKTSTGYELKFIPFQSDIIVDSIVPEPYYSGTVWYWHQEILGDATGHADHPVTYGITFKEIGRSPVARTSLPEPSTWALMIGGFGLVGASLRRAKSDARTREA